jgi:GTPase SAR1 family protein
LERLNEAKEVLKTMVNDVELVGVPILLCLNKQDVNGARKDLNGLIDLSAICGKGRMSLSQQTSALKGTGVEDGLNWIINAAKEFGPRKPALAN